MEYQRWSQSCDTIQDSIEILSRWWLSELGFPRTDRINQSHHPENDKVTTDMHEFHQKKSSSPTESFPLKMEVIILFSGFVLMEHWKMQHKLFSQHPIKSFSEWERLKTGTNEKQKTKTTESSSASFQVYICHDWDDEKREENGKQFGFFKHSKLEKMLCCILTDHGAQVNKDEQNIEVVPNKGEKGSCGETNDDGKNQRIVVWMDHDIRLDPDSFLMFIQRLIVKDTKRREKPGVSFSAGDNHSSVFCGLIYPQQKGTDPRHHPVSHLFSNNNKKTNLCQSIPVGLLANGCFAFVGPWEFEWYKTLLLRFREKMIDLIQNKTEKWIDEISWQNSIYQSLSPPMFKKPIQLDSHWFVHHDQKSTLLKV